MASRAGQGLTAGVARRQSPSWIGSFIAKTDHLESPRIYRQWTAIATLAAVLEQKVWVTTHSPIYPNLYTFLVGLPGKGKTIPIMHARRYLEKIPEFHIAPTSITAASMVDFLVKCTRFKNRLATNEEPNQYHTMAMFNDDWQVLMAKYEEETIALLTQFYDCWPYRQTRRTTDIDIQMARPQLNIIAGTTPSDLLNRLPASAWGAGFTSRAIFVYSSERVVVDSLGQKRQEVDPQLLGDLELINKVMGEFRWTEDYRKMMLAWREQDEEPKPTHPKLANYCSRRPVHLFKLSMIHAIDRGGELVLTEEDFKGAMFWLREAEENMSVMFDEGAQTIDAEAMVEIVEQVRRTNGTGMMKQTLIRIAVRKVGVAKVASMLDLMVLGGQLVVRDEKFYATD